MPRLQHDTFKVFVSHKSADNDLANVVADELRKLAPDVIDCWVSGQELTAGMDWDREIKRQLAQTHLLILLFTTPEHTWDWCLYEVGLFIRFEVEDVVSVACLFDPKGSPPAPLNQVQCVKATAEDIARQLIRPLLTETWDVSDTWQRGALVTKVSAAAVEAAATRIADEFHHTVSRLASGPSDDVYRYRPCHRIVLNLRQCAPAGPWRGIPRNAEVVEGAHDTTSYTLSLFRAHDGKRRTWGDLVDVVNGRNAPWLHALDKSFVESLSRDLWSPSMELMEVWQPATDSHRTYRPMITEVVCRSNDDVPIEVTLVLLPDGPHVVDAEAAQPARRSTDKKKVRS